LVVQTSPGWVKEEDYVAIEFALRQRQELLNARICDTLIDESYLALRDLVHFQTVVLCV